MTHFPLRSLSVFSGGAAIAGLWLIYSWFVSLVENNADDETPDSQERAKTTVKEGKIMSDTHNEVGKITVACWSISSTRGLL